MDNREHNHLFGEVDSEKAIVSMCEHRGNVYVATRIGIYIINGEELVRLRFVKESDEIVEER